MKQKIIAPKKIYGIDTGLINAIAFQFSENIARLMENIVLVIFLLFSILELIPGGILQKFINKII